MKTKKAAILGAGLSGLAIAWHLSRLPEFEVTLFDPGQIGENASGLAAGLLHPYPGAHAKSIKGGMEGYLATLELIAEVNPTAMQSTGILRVAVTDEQQSDFRICSENNEDVDWLDADTCQLIQPGLVSAPGILILSGKLIDTTAYLSGLWKACESRSIQWEKRKVYSLKELSSYDHIIVASGAEIAAIPELSHLPVRPVKGQLLEIEWPESLPPLKIPINSKAYILPTSDPSRCIVGATFERKFSSAAPDLATALEYLKPKMSALFPELEHAKIMDCRAGIRASTPDHFPLMQQVNGNTWVLTGMGSKGLLFHALYAKMLVDKIIERKF